MGKKRKTSAGAWTDGYAEGRETAERLAGTIGVADGYNFKDGWNNGFSEGVDAAAAWQPTKTSNDAPEADFGDVLAAFDFDMPDALASFVNFDGLFENEAKDGRELKLLRAFRRLPRAAQNRLLKSAQKAQAAADDSRYVDISQEGEGVTCHY
jgi:hypothetical protein